MSGVESAREPWKNIATRSMQHMEAANVTVLVIQAPDRWNLQLNSVELTSHSLTLHTFAEAKQERRRYLQDVGRGDVARAAQRRWLCRRLHHRVLRQHQPPHHLLRALQVQGPQQRPFPFCTTFAQFFPPYNRSTNCRGSSLQPKHKLHSFLPTAEAQTA